MKIHTSSSSSSSTVLMPSNSDSYSPNIPIDLPPYPRRRKNGHLKRYLAASQNEYDITQENMDRMWETSVSRRAMSEMTSQESRMLHKVPIARVGCFQMLFTSMCRVPPPVPMPSYRGNDAEDSYAQLCRFMHFQNATVEAARGAPSPSSTATVPMLVHEQYGRPVLNGRPWRNTAPPIGLFHPVFNSFQADLKESRPDSMTFTIVREFLYLASDVYYSLSDRVAYTKGFISSLLGYIFETIEVDGAKSDGVIYQACGNSRAYIIFREVQNEIGADLSDPSIHGSFTYRQFWVCESQDDIRRKTYCPSFILAIAGPWLCVLGAIYNESATVQPLTDYIWLGGSHLTDERLFSLARLFVALKRGISHLMEYYEAVDTELEIPRDPEFIHPAGYPYIHEFPFNNRKVTFAYKGILKAGYRKKLLFKAELKEGSVGSRPAKLDGTGPVVVVKFAPSYNAKAHRLLAQKNLAPRLLYSSTEGPVPKKYGGLYMIVMEYFEGSPVTCTLPHSVHNIVRYAVKLLHSKGFVFGDLRQPNILIGCKRLVFVDFDWCGKAGEARYPVGINMDGSINWPDGVGPGTIMEKDHDLVMLERL